jgi:hypothetical protein
VKALNIGGDEKEILVGRGGRYKVKSVKMVDESEIMTSVLPKSMQRKIEVIDLEYMGGGE